MRNTNRKPQLSIELEQDFYDEIKQIAKRTQIPAARIAREGLFEKVALLKRTHPRLIIEPEAVNPAAK